ncbi:roadblock/LC7 domain-containing protein [Actinocatenispora rupis]|uniref:Dynein regulation protein LC7 n=1 Tax=Actinocatenispora rupis TaxID=519421 RepID=A0A8J3J3Z5_9ACTN|nr:roadblock/LC7 domain-containing protein [Actinocatenispora rupis]GID11522.1 dynein regulation protein LC7 [Actinocatenispora rupis]
MSRDSRLTWLLDDLADRTRADLAILFTADGLLRDRSTGTDPLSAEQISARCAGICGGAKSMASVPALGGARFEQALIGMDGRVCYMCPAGDQTYVAVVVDRGVDLGMLTFEVQRVVDKVGEHLGTQVRRRVFSDTSPGRGVIGE